MYKILSAALAVVIACTTASTSVFAANIILVEKLEVGMKMSRKATEKYLEEVVGFKNCDWGNTRTCRWQSRNDGSRIYAAIAWVSEKGTQFGEVHVTFCGDQIIGVFSGLNGTKQIEHTALETFEHAVRGQGRPKIATRLVKEPRGGFLVWFALYSNKHNIRIQSVFYENRAKNLGQHFYWNRYITPPIACP